MSLLFYLYTLINPCQEYSLINSVDFHPQKNLFCVTYTQGDKVILYEDGKVVQELKNPLAHLNRPQHALFSPDGNKLVVTNWDNQTLTLYRRKKDHYSEAPIAIIPIPLELIRARAHGLSFSPCGKFIAVAYGGTLHDDRAVALIHLKEEKWVSVLKELPGTPKGITFSPDGTVLLVTFSDINSLMIYEVDQNKINPHPVQIIQGKDTAISRPEDVKITADGKFVALTNSDQNNITFYPFEKNRVSESFPCYTLEDNFCFPHGLAFSSDGSLMAVTEFGPIETTPEGGILFEGMPPHLSQVRVYRILGSSERSLSPKCLRK